MSNTTCQKNAVEALLSHSRTRGWRRWAWLGQAVVWALLAIAEAIVELDHTQRTALTQVQRREERHFG